jgi:hypothetical protein
MAYLVRLAGTGESSAPTADINLGARVKPMVTASPFKRKFGPGETKLVIPFHRAHERYGAGLSLNIKRNTVHSAGALCGTA